MKKIFLIGPSKERYEYQATTNTRQAEYYASEIIKKRGDLLPITPHKLFEGMSGLQPDAYFIEGALEVLGCCDYVYYLPNWEKSPQAVGQDRRAKELKIEDLTEVLDEM